MESIKRNGLMFFCLIFTAFALYGVLFLEGENVKQGIIYSSFFGLMMWVKWTEHELKKQENANEKGK